MAGPIRLFQIGQRGLDITDKPQDLDDSELVTAQNVEVATSAGGGALDQRPGMTRIGNSPLSGAVAMALDIPSKLLTDYTPYLYAGLYTGATHNWRYSADGVTWLNDDTPAKPFSNNLTNITLYAKDFPKACVINNKMYYVTGDSPIQLRSYDGTTDSLVATIPPAVSGVTLATPVIDTVDSIGSAGATTYTYKMVAIAGTNHSAASAARSHPTLSATMGDGTGGTVLLIPSPSALPVVAGATSYDVYRTSGGATQGKVGNIPIVGGNFTLGNGHGNDGTHRFTDDGIVGDASTAPSSASGGTSGDAIAVLDMITDGASLYVAALDAIGTDPNPVGRILQFFPLTSTWSQIGLPFPIATGNGTAGTLVNFDGALSYGTHIGVTAGNNAYLTTTSHPLPAGGVNDVKLVGAMPTTLAVFNGELYIGVTFLAATAAIVARRNGSGSGLAYTTTLTADASAAKNGYTAMGVFNGRLFAGWTSGGGATAANIYSTPDGITWTLEKTFATTDVPCQMVTFGTSLYVVMGKTGIGYNTTSSIWQRSMSGTWTQVDDPADDFAGCLAVLYK